MEAKTTLNARDVPAVLDQLRTARSPITDAGTTPGDQPLYRPRPRAMFAEAGASYMDATGNLRIEIERPAVFLEAAGASADPWRGPERETRTLRGKPAARVVRALVDFAPPLGIRELSKRSGASLGSTYRTVDFPDKEALIARGEDGAVVAVQWADLLARWSEDYSFQGSNPVRPGLEPDQLAKLGRVLDDRGLARAPKNETPTVLEASLTATSRTSVGSSTSINEGYRRFVAHRRTASGRSGAP